MKIENFDEISRDVALLKEIVARLKRYMRIKVEISELEDIHDIKINDPPQANLKTTKPNTLSEGIRNLIRTKGIATSSEIYEYLEQSGFSNIEKKKNSLRSILSMMKKNGEIEGNAYQGFKNIQKKGVVEGTLL